MSQSLRVLVDPGGSPSRMLSTCIASASGGRALGQIPVVAAPCLYLALEDPLLRLQSRLQLLLGDDGVAPPQLDIATTWPPIDDHGLEELERWLQEHPTARLVAIDTLKRIRPHADTRRQLYDIDYEAVQPLAELAGRYHVAIVLVHHLRKAVSDDPVDLVSGTLGLAGAADAVAVLRRERGKADASLYIAGREMEETELALQWSSGWPFGWTLLGDAAEHRLSTERTAIIELLRRQPGLKPKAISDALGKTGGSVRFLLSAMFKDGLLVNSADGGYSVSITHTTNNGFSTNTANSTNRECDEAGVASVRPLGLLAVHSANGRGGSVRNGVCLGCGEQRGLDPVTKRCDDCEAAS